jgi:hypothetical protein
VSWYEQPGPPPAGWYPDPGGHGQRWWDGSRWTEHYAPPPPGGAYLEQQPPVPAAAPPPATAQTEPPVSSLLPPPEFWVAAVAMVVLLAGSVAPWVTIEASGFGQTFSRDVSGLRGDAPGVLTLLAGVTAGVLLCVWLFERAVLLPAVAVFFGCVAAVVAIDHVSDPASGARVPAFLEVKAAWGAWAALVGAVVLVLAAAVMTVRTRTRA